MRKALAIGLLGAVGGVFALEWLGRRWGATDDEVHAALAGDDMVAHPWLETTHAITIHASPGDVWPWLVQMGYGRAGWYTNAWWYRLIDRYLFRVEMVRATRIIPELQRLAEGDVIPDGPPGTASFTVAHLEPERALALYSTTHGTVWLPRGLRENPTLGIHGELGWTFVLREGEAGTTRLILHSRVSGGPAPYRVFAQVFMPPADFVVARLMLRTIKRNAERSARGAFTDVGRPGALATVMGQQ